MSGQQRPGKGVRNLAASLVLLLLSFGIALAVAELAVRRFRPLEPPMWFG